MILRHENLIDKLPLKTEYKNENVLESRWREQEFLYSLIGVFYAEQILNIFQIGNPNGVFESKLNNLVTMYFQDLQCPFEDPTDGGETK